MIRENSPTGASGSQGTNEPRVTPFHVLYLTSVMACPVGRGIRPALGRLYGEVEQSLRQELGRASVADVLRQTLESQAQ
jgi:hypothetical protein